MFIDGKWVDSGSKKKFKSLNPENNEPWVEGARRVVKRY
ncbi:MAG: hypothetical protein CM1200mP13_15860 [Candidatus Pelagibacterales bacterium]|nr:MAG: hypothetical protein CM1200mP13_15860 [Pelagibacterales bacterium]